MDIMHLLDRLETVLASGARIPLSGKTVVDEHECLDIIDQLRVAVPEEVKQAKRLQTERERLLEDAEGQAARIVAHAQEQAALMVDGDEILKAAEAKARRILEDAQMDAAERLEGADRYAMETLQELESRLSELLSLARNGVHALSKDRRQRDALPEVD